MTDSDSDSPLSTALGSSAFQTNSIATQSPSSDILSSTEPDLSCGFVTIQNRQYLVVDHAANIRKGTSPWWIWGYGRELRLFEGGEWQKCWQCSLCGQGQESIYIVDDSTYNAGQHLRKKHKVIKAGEDIPERSRAPDGNIGAQLTGVVAKALTTGLAVDHFRYLLIRWMVLMHLTLSIIEHESFREL